MRSLARASLIPIFTILAIVGNAIPNIFRLNGQTTGSISNKYPSLFTPAGYAFSIWSLIYLSLLAFSFYQLRAPQREDPRIARIEGPYLISCVFNTAWIFAWQYEQMLLSLVLIVGLLVSLLVAYVRLDQGRQHEQSVDAWLVDYPFSLYTGWVTVATIANTVAVLVSFGWSGAPLTAAIWSALLICIALGVGIAVAWPRQDITYLGVLIWAIIAIGVAHAQLLVRTTAWGVAGLLTLTFLWILLRRETTNRPATTTAAASSS